AVRGEDAALYEAALALYAGDLLSEDLYEDWAAVRREGLRTTRLGLLSKLAALYEARGEYEPGVRRLRELVGLEPSDEDVQRRLMRLHALAGDRHQAMRQYRECREALRRELDSEPEPETVRLYEQIAAKQFRPARSGEGRDAGHPAAIDSLAVLPLTNASGDPELEYLSDGITESVIHSLSRLPGLRVMAWSTVSRYRNAETNPQEVGRALGVRGVLTGRVVQSGDGLIVKIELVDAHDGSHLWGERYDLRPADASAVEGGISNDISEKLRLKLTGEERRRLARRHTENTEAYHAYLKGRYYWNKRDTAWLKKGAEHFRHAIDLDPGYASAYAGLSDSYTLLVVREAVPPEDGFAKAKAAAAMALRIDETLAEARASLGHAMLHNWEWDDAERELKIAIGMNPGYPSAHHWYSEHLTAMGRCEESIAELKLAARLDPLSLVINADLGRAFYYARRYDEVVGQEAKTLEMDPGFWLSHINLGKSYTQTGRHAEAVGELRKAGEASPGNTEVLSFLGFAYAAAGERDEALKALRELEERSERGHVPPYHLAIAHAGLGHQDHAFEWLERAYQRHSVDFFTLKVEPMLDGLRPEARFQNLLRRARLAP
ncbi:MAG: BTAD domain-containing putative transcriptional regulator, partial [Pyrinomonadaceae bacterium]